MIQTHCDVCGVHGHSNDVSSSEMQPTIASSKPAENGKRYTNVYLTTFAHGLNGEKTGRWAADDLDVCDHCRTEIEVLLERLARRFENNADAGADEARDLQLDGAA